MPPALTWLVRHGQSAANAGLPATGHATVPLTELGRAQARALALRLKRPPDLLILSPFLRARATAEPILSRWPDTLCETWPIQELTYLSPARCTGTTSATRRPWIDDYWHRCEPDYCRRAGRRIVRRLHETPARLPPSLAWPRCGLRRRRRARPVLPRLYDRSRQGVRRLAALDEGLQDRSRRTADGQLRRHETGRRCGARRTAAYNHG